MKACSYGSWALSCMIICIFFSFLAETGMLKVWKMHSRILSRGVPGCDDGCLHQFFFLQKRYNITRRRFFRTFPGGFAPGHLRPGQAAISKKVVIVPLLWFLCDYYETLMIWYRYRYLSAKRNFDFNDLRSSILCRPILLSYENCP